MKLKETSGKSVLFIHIIICVVLLSIPVLDAPLSHDGNIDYRFIIRDLLKYILILCFFYLNYFLLIPRFYFRKRYVAFGIIALVCFVVISLVPSFFEPAHLPMPRQEGMSHHAPPPFQPSLVGKHLIYSFLSFAVAFSVSFLLRITNAFATAKAEKAQLEFTYLKAQIHPHFLFNTLNAIYALAVKKSEKTPEAIQELSEMMRYIMHDATRDFIPLEKEITYLENYIELQKNRYSYTLEVIYNKTGNADGLQIAPLILIPFVENAFKHGVSPEKKSKISINVHMESDRLEFRVENTKVQQQKSSMDFSGIGIKNTRSRLGFIYAGKHELSIAEDNERYSVLLMIRLK